MAPRLLVLGAGGFLGRSIAHHVAATGDAELILHARNADDCAGFGDGVESHALDLLTCDPGAIAEMIDEVAPDAVVNCTGSAVGDLDHMTTANVVVVLRLIAELEKCKSVHLVHLGSAAEYGIQQHNTPVSETMPATPQSAYGHTKLRATEHLMQAAAENRISVTVLRVFNPVGRFSPETTLPGSAARKIAVALRSGAPAINLGALDSWRDYVDTRDIGRAVVAAAVTMPQCSRVLNVGRGEAVESLHLVKTLAKIAGYSGEIVESDARSLRSASVDWLCADVQAMKDDLGLAAEYTIEEALGELWSGISTSGEWRE
jgi:nucleoside-diphosphate-sugar epimerase